MIKKLFYWVPAILYMAVIYYLSCSAAPEPAKAMPIYRYIKTIHIIEYGLLSVLMFFALAKSADRPSGWKFVYAAALTYIYGLTDELHQVFVPSRSGQLTDTIANLIGICLFLALIRTAIKTGKSSSNG